MYVAGCPEAWRGVPVDLNVTKRGQIVVVLSYHKVEAEQQRSQLLGSRRAWLGRGNSG